tara:strand:+ start:3170 stop:5512 length:2343 start_codon:yes stop_codon:yes gene_type:complete
MADKKTLQERSEAAQRLADALGRVTDATKEGSTEQIEYNRALDAANQANQAYQLSLGDNAAIDAAIAATKEHAEKLSKLEERYKKTKEAQDNFANAADKMGKELAGLIPIVGGNKDIMGSFAGQLVIASKQAKGMGKGLSNMLGSLKKSVTGVQGFTNVLAFSEELITGIIVSSFQLGIELQSVGAGFNKATGAAGAFDESMNQAFRSSLQAGVTFKEQAAATQALFTETARFTDMSKTSQASLMQTTAVLGEFGIDAGIAAQSLNIMTTSMGMTGIEAEHTSRRLLTAAESMGVAPAEMAADFAATGKQFASFGETAIDAFIDLKEVAKKTGIELQSLLGITEKFTTFEGAADSVGSLNALLGGPFLNTIDMVTLSLEDPAAAMQEVRNAVLDAGLSFEDMNPAMRRAVASAAGLEDASQLAALMSGEMDGLGGASSETAKQLEELKEATKFTQTFSDELEATRLAFTASFKPVIDFVIGALNVLQSFAGWLSTNIHPGAPAVLGVIVGLALMKLAMFKLSGMVAAAAAPLTVLTSEIALLNTQLATLNLTAPITAPALAPVGPVAGAVGKQMIFLGAAVLMVGAGIGLAALGMAEFVKAFALIDEGKLGGVALNILSLALSFGVLLGAISLFANPLTTAGIAVLGGVALVILSIGAAIGIAAAGMSLLVGSFAGIGDEVEKVATAFESLTVAKMATFTVAMTATAAAGMTPGGAMMMAAGAMVMSTATKETEQMDVAVKVVLEGKAEKLFKHKSSDSRYVKKNEVTPNSGPSEGRLEQ